MQKSQDKSPFQREILIKQSPADLLGIHKRGMCIALQLVFETLFIIIPGFKKGIGVSNLKVRKI